MEMQFKNEIKKLADVVVWADGIIRDAGYNEEKYKSDGSTAYCHVKAHELWRIRDVALKSIERHAVYTNALNNDIAEKAAKIELLEKEIEGRKEGYIALKVRMDTKYISIDDHNDVCKAYEKKVVELKKEIEKWQDLAKMNRDTICNQYNVCEEFKNKITELEEMTRYWESQYEYVLKCRKEDIEDLEGRLKEEIDLVRSAEERLIELQKENEELENTVKRLNKELADRNVKIRHQKENLDGINKTLEIRTKENESLIKVRNNLNKEIEGHEHENKRLSEKIMSMHNTITELSHEIDNYKSWNASLHKDTKELKEENSKLENQVKYLEKELNETCTCKELDLKGHNRREIALVNELADKNDEIKELKEENSYLKSEIKQKQNIIMKAYERYSDDIIKTRKDLMKDLMEVAYRDIEKDNGYVGFKLYVKSALIEAKGDKNEANEIITDAVKFYFNEWDKTQKEKEEETEINDIPCGEDAIE